MHMPFCDGIVGLARDNTAHLFHEKTLGCEYTYSLHFLDFCVFSIHAIYSCSYARQLPLWSEKAQPRYIMNACEIEGGRAFAFCASLPPLSALLMYAISIK